MRATILGDVRSVTPDIVSGDDKELQLSTLGEVFSADWKNRLVRAGRVYRMSWGTITGGTDAVPVGAGTVVNLDQPQGVIANDSGYIIPIELDFGLVADLDAANDQAQLLVTVDRATAVAAGATGTVETPDNLLDGGAAFGGRAWSLITSDITDPVHSDVLYYKTWFFRPNAAATQGAMLQNLNAQKEWTYPQFLAGPCSILIYFGGVVAVTAIGSFVFAHVPSTWAPTS